LTDAQRVLRETSAIPRSVRALGASALLETLHRDADALRERELALDLAPVVGGRVLAVVARAMSPQRIWPRLRPRRGVGRGRSQRRGCARRARADYRQEGREADALAELTVASLLDSSRDTTLSALAQIHLGAGRFDEAVEAARRALAKNPQNGDARVTLEFAEAKRLR
jgi:tetratricopeptide (TPR) repeat protein